MYDNWCIEVGNRLHDPVKNKTYLILSQNRGDFLCLRYNEEDQSYCPEYVNIEREGLYKMFHLLTGRNVKETIVSPQFKDINFYLHQTSVYTNNVISTFKFYPTIEELIVILSNLEYPNNSEQVAKDLVVNKKVLVDSTFILEIKEY